jgi:hypothetical protein
VYDEVHLLPAPIFRMTADLQARRRLGLTATLVREDGREGDVFSLIGPKRYDAPWKDIEAQGWIAPADCVEVRVTLPSTERMAYAVAEPEERYRLASCTHHKIDVVRRLIDNHPGQPTLVIGQYLDQLDEIATALDAPDDHRGDAGQGTAAARSRPSGRARSACWWSPRWRTSRSTCRRRRWRSRCRGRSGRARRRPSGSAGLLRPKTEGKTAHFYTIVIRDTVDAEFAANRSGSWPSRGTPTPSGTRTTEPMDAQEVAFVFGLGRAITLSGPFARGEIGVIRRLVTDRGSWAVKQDLEPLDAADVAAAELSAAFHHRCWQSGIPTPEPVRSRAGEFVVRLSEAHVRASRGSTCGSPTRRSIPVPSAPCWRSCTPCRHRHRGPWTRGSRRRSARPSGGPC